MQNAPHQPIQSWLKSKPVVTKVKIVTDFSGESFTSEFLYLKSLFDTASIITVPEKTVFSTGNSNTTHQKLSGLNCRVNWTRAVML